MVDPRPRDSFPMYWAADYMLDRAIAESSAQGNLLNSIAGNDTADIKIRREEPIPASDL